jgi:hypothetical protein
VTNSEFDLRAEDSQPVPRLAALLLSMAIEDRAERMDISLDDISSDLGVRISVSVGGIVQEYAPAPGLLFEPLVIVFCNYAGVAYYSKGRTEGTIDTRRPKSTWRLQSDDLRGAFVLTRVSPIPPIRKSPSFCLGT